MERPRGLSYSVYCLENSFRPGADYARKFPRFLDGLPDGCVVMCHPGHVDE